MYTPTRTRLGPKPSSAAPRSPVVPRSPSSGVSSSQAQGKMSSPAYGGSTSNIAGTASSSGSSSYKTPTKGVGNSGGAGAGGGRYGITPLKSSSLLTLNSSSSGEIGSGSASPSSPTLPPHLMSDDLNGATSRSAAAGPLQGGAVGLWRAARDGHSPNNNNDSGNTSMNASGTNSTIMMRGSGSGAARPSTQGTPAARGGGRLGVRSPSTSPAGRYFNGNGGNNTSAPLLNMSLDTALIGGLLQSEGGANELDTLRAQPSTARNQSLSSRGGGTLAPKKQQGSAPTTTTATGTGIYRSQSVNAAHPTLTQAGNGTRFTAAHTHAQQMAYLIPPLRLPLYRRRGQPPHELVSNEEAEAQRGGHLRSSLETVLRKGTGGVLDDTSLASTTSTQGATANSSTSTSGSNSSTVSGNEVISSSSSLPSSPSSASQKGVEDTTAVIEAHPAWITVIFDLDETLCNNRLPGKAMLRNGCMELLQALAAIRDNPEVNCFIEIILWTASMECVARPVLERMDPTNTIFNHLIFRDRRWYQERSYTKDLKLLGRDLSHVVIIENSPMSVVLNRKHAILVKDFVGGGSVNYYYGGGPLNTRTSTGSPNDPSLFIVKRVLCDWASAVGSGALATLEADSKSAKSRFDPAFIPLPAPLGIVEFLRDSSDISASNEVVLPSTTGGVGGFGTFSSSTGPMQGSPVRGIRGLGGVAPTPKSKASSTVPSSSLWASSYLRSSSAAVSPTRRYR